MTIKSDALQMLPLLDRGLASSPSSRGGGGGGGTESIMTKTSDVGDHAYASVFVEFVSYHAWSGHCQKAECCLWVSCVRTSLQLTHRVNNILYLLSLDNLDLIYLCESFVLLLASSPSFMVLSASFLQFLHFCIRDPNSLSYFPTTSAGRCASKRHLDLVSAYQD